MITVHHLNNSRSQRILWLLEELATPYQIKKYQRDATTNLAPPELTAIHPLGKSPVITDDGTVVIESGAIVEYIVTKHGNGRLVPDKNSSNWVKYLQWMHYAEGSAMLPLMLSLYAGRLGAAAEPLMPRIQAETANHLGYMESALAKSEYFAGPEFTACDVQLSFVEEVARAFGQLAKYPRLANHLERMQARPAYLRALEKGGPYNLGPTSQSTVRP
ncbi:MAG TPA: glutathione S-transferase [Candidatus Binataceae bacterium]|jgi:glutathione S-transferase